MAPCAARDTPTSLFRLRTKRPKFQEQATFYHYQRVSFAAAQGVLAAAWNVLKIEKELKERVIENCAICFRSANHRGALIEWRASQKIFPCTLYKLRLL